jgi:hypothetical protein
VNVSTKSGTNEFHGTAFEFLRNDKLDARNFFDGAQISPLRQNQYGFVLGGPVWIPKLYNGKNKSFFLANYEAGKVRSNAIQYATVPTPEQLKGRFSTTITDPVSGAAFPNNVIPAASFSRLGPLFAEEIGTAVPNNPGPLNYVMHNSSPSDGWQQTYRWDQYFGANDQFFGRFTFMNSSGGGYAWPDKASWRGHSTPVKSLQTVYTHTFSLRVINQARFGWLHNEDDTEGTPASQATLDKLGIKGVYTGIPGTTYPLVTLTGYGEYGGAPNTPSLSTGTNWDASDSLSINLGRHTINTGANFRHYQLFDTGSGGYYGEWDYSGAYTGDAVADMLLGYMGRVSATVPTFISPKPAFTTVNKFYIAPYVQDDWRVNERLTVNLGLRYDYTSLPTEEHNLNAWWDYTNKLGGLCVADKKVIDAGLGSDVYRYCGANPGTAPSKVFAPRVGLAYRPFGGTKTVIRGGYGIYYDSTEREFAGSYVYYPYGAGITTQAYPEDPTKWVRSDNQLPVLTPGPVDRSQVMGFVGGGFPRTLAPYSQQWTFSVQRELTRATVFEASYLGTKGTHLLTRSNINQPYPYDPKNPLSIEARRPYPTVGVALTELYDSSSSYNALNLKLQHHTGDLNLLVNYAWSKSIDNKSAASTAGSDQGWGGVTNQWNLRYDRGLSDFDTPQRLVIAFNYDLPLGHGKRFLPSLNKAGNLLLGGWQLNGIANFQSGAAYSIMSYDFSGLLGLTAQHMQRADIVGDPNSGFHRSLSQWFNTAAFNWPADGRFGTSGRNIMRGPGYANWDLSLFKNIPVYGERARLQLRGESFNAFNHTQFDHPDGYMIDPIFGMIAGARSGRIIQVAAKLIF